MTFPLLTSIAENLRLAAVAQDEAKRLSLIFKGPHWASYSLTATFEGQDVAGEITLNFREPKNPFAIYLLNRAKRRWKANTLKVSQHPLEEIRCCPFDWSDSMDRLAE